MIGNQNLSFPFQGKVPNKSSVDRIYLLINIQCHSKMYHLHSLTVSIFRVRLPPPVLGSSQDSSSSNINRFTEGEEIEVFSRASDQESCGWWRAVIKMIKGEFHVVEYLGWETTYTEVRTCQAGIVKVKNRVFAVITNFHFIILFLSFL